MWMLSGSSGKCLRPEPVLYFLSSQWGPQKNIDADAALSFNDMTGSTSMFKQCSLQKADTLI